ncbi:MAG: hypothetical protein AAF514_15735, partial [Verrucomicrobiota bacterium]
AIDAFRADNAEVIEAQKELAGQIKEAIKDLKGDAADRGKPDGGGREWGLGLSDAAKALRDQIKSKHEELKGLRKADGVDKDAFRAEYEALKELRKALIDEVRKAREDGNNRSDDDAE